MAADKGVDKAVYNDAANALKIAKITMMMGKNTTFYTTILFSLKQTITEELPTAATDGCNLLINPQFFYDLSPNKRLTLLAHEVLHVALDHMHRVGKRDHQLWNIAGDYVINGHLAKAGYELPDGGLLDRKYDGMTTEQVYDLLDKKSEQEKQSIITKMGSGIGADIQYPDQAEPGKAVTKDEVTEIILRASTQAQAMGQDPGSLPGEIAIQLQRTLNPPLPWYTILQNYLTEFNKDDYSFRRPNRRFLPHYYLPTAHSKAICNIAAFVDSSSSVSDSDFDDFITKVAEVQKVLQPKKITVVAFDTRIKSVQELTENDDPFRKLKFAGRGGTQIAPVHKWIAEHKPTVTLIFTDGEFQQHAPIDPRCPIVWLIYDDPQWKSRHGGRVIHYEPKKI